MTDAMGVDGCLIDWLIVDWLVGCRSPLADFRFHWSSQMFEMAVMT
jgi:hypothetical protein